MITLDNLRIYLVRAVALAVLGLALTGTAARAAQPSAAPAWSLTPLATPTNFIPGDTEHDFTYDVRLANVGGAASDGSPITLTDTLPEGLVVEGVDFYLRTSSRPLSANPVNLGAETYGLCSVTPGPPATVTCTIPETFPEAIFGPTSDEPAVMQPGEEVRMVIHVFTTPGTGPGSVSNHVEVQGGGAASKSIAGENAVTSEADPQPASSGFAFSRIEVTGPDGLPVSQAGSHPYQYTTSYAVNTELGRPGNDAKFVPAGGDVKDIPVVLPPGLVGNPNAVERCTAQEFNENVKVELGVGVFYVTSGCPDGSVVGFVRVQQNEGQAVGIPVPLYDLVPPPGEPAQFGFKVESLPFFIDTEVRPSQNYRIAASVRNQTQAKRVSAASVTIWGVPDDPGHDPLRGRCLSAFAEKAPISAGDCPANGDVRPLLRMPTSCSSPLNFLMSMDNWATPGTFVSRASELPAPSGCGQVPFDPTLEAHPVSDTADSPTGLHADLHLPQPEGPEELGEADLRNAVVKLSPGLVINPAGANGLGSCSEDQVGYLGRSGGVDSYSDSPAACPNSSKIGTVEVDTPLIAHPLRGGVYVATPHQNPFDSLLAIYVGIDDPASGIVVKLAGHVEADAGIGQLTTTFDGTPQLPFSDFKLDFFGGDTAALRSPQTCGKYTTEATLTPWSAPEGHAVNWSDHYSISKGPGGGNCPSTSQGLANAPLFTAGTQSPIAGGFSPTALYLGREDGSQEWSSLNVTLPPGLLARLAGVPYCPEGALAAAGSRTGSAEKASPSCPVASRVGTVDVGAGAGPKPYYVDGNVYLAGPYKGAPLSLAIVTPAVAGPYDLGTVVVRVALQVNPVTAQVTAVSDPIPHILEGIPLDLRSISLKIDRDRFTRNPTSCERLSVAGQELSVEGLAASLLDRFQVGSCGRLKFGPRLKMTLRGGTKRGQYPALRAVLRAKAGEAGIKRVSVALPHSEFLAQEHIATICTRAEFAAGGCPRGSVYGHAEVWTPLLDKPLEGPVYLRSSNHELPDLVAALHGQIDIELSGKIDEYKQGIRTTFQSVPDAPVSRFVLTMKGGKKSLLVNSVNTCRSRGKATVRMRAHNGKVHDFAAPLRRKCHKH
jgi:hypothetical protein